MEKYTVLDCRPVKISGILYQMVYKIPHGKTREILGYYKTSKRNMYNICEKHMLEDTSDEIIISSYGTPYFPELNGYEYYMACVNWKKQNPHVTVDLLKSTRLDF